MRRRPTGKSFGISLALHLLIVVPLLFLARPPQPLEFETIAINLVSPPPAEAQAPEVVEAAVQPEPEPEPVAPEPTPQAVKEPPKTPPEPKKEEIEKPETEKPPETPEPKPETKPSDRPAPDSAVVGGDDLNIRTEGREFTHTAYLENVLTQVRRYFRWPETTRPKGVVYFEILRDGSVRNIRMHQPSGNIQFDFRVMGAVETAAQRGAFGALPDDYVPDILPVRLEVEPPR